MVDVRLAGAAQQGRVSIPRAHAGVEIARGLGQLGGSLFNASLQDREMAERQRQIDHQVEMAELERRRQAEVADAAGRFADWRGELATYGEELRIGPDAKPGAQGHGATFQAEGEKRAAEFLGTLSNDPVVRQRFEPMIRGSLADFNRRETAWELSERAKHQGNQYQKYSDAKNIDLAKSPTMENLKGAMEEAEGLIDDMGVPATARAHILDQTFRAYAETVLKAQIAGGQQSAAREILDQGYLDEYLTPDGRERLLAGADRADARDRIEAEQQELKQRREARETINAIDALLKVGATPTEKEMDAARAAIKLLPPADQIEFAGLEAQLEVNRDTRGASSAAIRNTRDFLQAKVNAGTATQTEQIHLKAYSQRLEAQLDQDAAEQKEILGQGTAGRIQAVENLQSVDAANRFATLERAEAGLGHVALLPAASSRRQAIEGRAIRKAQKDLFDEKLAKAAFGSAVGSVRAILGEQFDDKLEIAMDLYAAHVAEKPQKNFNANLFAQYSSIAFGATKRADGIWQGGLATVNGRRTVIPDNLSADEFRKSIARTDWSNARNAAGEVEQKAFIINQMAPVLVEEQADRSFYHMVDRHGQYLLAPNGQRLRLSVGNGIGQ